MWKNKLIVHFLQKNCKIEKCKETKNYIMWGKKNES